jgi:NADH-quinone oxidoreductase subunit H
MLDLSVSVVRVLISMFFPLLLVPVLVWAERKGAAYIQDRRGPNRASIAGLTLGGMFHPLADAVKLLFKEDFIPDHAHKLLYQMAPVFAVGTALMTFAVVPFGPDVTIMGKTFALQGAPLNVGILYLFAIAGLGVYGVILAGYASGSKFPLFGSLRSSAQMLSYEVTMGLSIIGILMVYRSVQLNEIVLGQGDYLFGFIPKWGVVVQPLAFIIFIVAIFAEANRTPFDLPEGESELVAGFHTEYGSFKFSMFFMAEYVHMVVGAAVIVTLFFGGWQVPFLADQGFGTPGNVWASLPSIAVTLIRVGAFMAKLLFFSWFFIWVRWTIPRFRYDQVMRLGWKVLLPLSLANIFVTGLVLLLIDRGRF